MANNVGFRPGAGARIEQAQRTWGARTSLAGGILGVCFAGPKGLVGVPAGYLAGSLGGGGYQVGTELAEGPLKPQVNKAGNILGKALFQLDKKTGIRFY